MSWFSWGIAFSIPLLAMSMELVNWKAEKKRSKILSDIAAGKYGTLDNPRRNEK